MNDHMLGAGHSWLCGDSISIADYLVSGILSLGEVIGCTFSAWPNVQRWYERLQALPNWAAVNAPLYAWAAFARGPDYIRL